MTLVEKRSKPWVDGLRGLAMLFVLLGHVGMPGWFYVITSPIKIPLFFAITGYLFRDRGGKQLEFFGNLLLHLVLPWLILAMIPAIPDAFTQGPMRLWYRFLDVITGRAAWYMPCCIIAQVLHFYVRKLCRHTTAVAVASLLLAVLGYVLGMFHILDTAMFNLALVCQLFLLVGFLFSRWEGKNVLTGWLGAVLGLLVYGTLCALSLKLFPGQGMDIRNHEFYHIPLCLLLICLGCLMVMTWGSCIGKAPAALRFVGQNTLVFYIWQPYPWVATKKILALFGLPIPAGWAGKALELSVTILGCAAISILFNWLIPELVGKKRSKKHK